MSDTTPAAVKVITTASITGSGPVTAADYRRLLNSRLEPVPNGEGHTKTVRVPEVPADAVVTLEWDQPFDLRDERTCPWTLTATWTPKAGR
jgi:hypothetical protein